jgi:hypothetical protein
VLTPGFTAKKQAISCQHSALLHSSRFEAEC